MARNTEYDADGNLVSDITEPTGVSVEIGSASRRTLLQRIFG